MKKHIHNKSAMMLVLFLLILAIVFVFITFIVTDSMKTVTADESLRNFDDYIIKIDEYMNAQNIHFNKEDSGIGTSDIPSRTIIYSLDNESKIVLELYNDNEKEQYSLSYTSGCDTAVGTDTNIDMNIVYEMLKIVSGKTIDKDELETVMMQRNGKYKMELLNEETVHNGKELGFYGYWKIRYIRESNKLKPLYNDMPYYDRLNINGLTVYGTK